MNNKTTRVLSRREFLQRALALGMATAGAGVVLSACGKKEEKKPEAKKPAAKKPEAKKALKCDDAAGLSDADKATRKNNAYVDKSTTAGKKCDNCQLYQAKAPGACGGCAVVKGPIHPDGYCRVWVKKA